MSAIRFAADVMAADLGRLEEQFKALEAAGCHELHFNVQDGAYAPVITLGPSFVRLAKRCCGLPCAVHLLTERPDRHIDAFVAAGADAIVVQQETDIHIQRTLTRIREAGISPGVAIGPSVTMTKLEYSLDYVDRVLLLATEPGAHRTNILPEAFDRTRILKANLGHRQLRAVIETEGATTVKEAALLVNLGALSLVLGVKTLFQKDKSIVDAFTEFQNGLAVERNLV